jgi:hypothetical protein
MQQDADQRDPVRWTDAQDVVLTSKQLNDLNNEAKQEEYRWAYQRQLDRRSCPECGEP